MRGGVKVGDKVRATASRGGLVKGQMYTVAAVLPTRLRVLKLVLAGRGLSSRARVYQHIVIMKEDRP